MFENFFNKKFNRSLPVSAGTWYHADEEGNGTHSLPGKETKWGKSWEGKGEWPGAQMVWAWSVGSLESLESRHTTVCTFFFLNWSIIDLQCCVRVWCTAKWFSDIYTYTHIYTHIFFFISFSIIVHDKILNIVPSVSKSLQLICFVYSSICLFQTYYLIPPANPCFPLWKP